jgi:acetoin utilization deacetylase AcuC-like enzyme
MSTELIGPREAEHCTLVCTSRTSNVERHGTIRFVPLTLFTSPVFADHLTPPGHPERVERFAVMQAVAAEFRRQGVAVEAPRVAREAELARIHGIEHVSLIKETAGRAVALDPDTFTSPRTWDAACMAAGAAVSAVEHVLDSGKGARACALVRPPGHHAERGRAMGFCFFNNIAIAAAHARALGLSRVAIVDIDVHHGNGTQWSFYDDPNVLFVSSHQYPYYPGTGAASDIGTGAGAGFTLNLPLSAGATDNDYEAVYARLALPVVSQFRPELILVSAGFDAHMDDPLAGMRLTTRYFGRLMQGIAEVADRCCDGKVVAVTEGGYDLGALAGSLRASIGALVNEETFDAPEGPSPRGHASIEAVMPHASQYWKL